MVLWAPDDPEFKIETRLSLVNIHLVTEILISGKTYPCLWSVSFGHILFSWSIFTGWLVSGWSSWSSLIIWTTSRFEHTSKARSSWWPVFVPNKAQRRLLISYRLKTSNSSYWANHTFPVFCPKDDFSGSLSKDCFRCLLELSLHSTKDIFLYLLK